MKGQTLLKNALWVGGGMFVAGVASSQLIQPNIQSLDLNPTLKSLVAPGAIIAGAYFTQDMLPSKVLYGAIGLAGYNAIQSTMGTLGQPQEQDQQA